jgi:hypothetical protein
MPPHQTLADEGGKRRRVTAMHEAAIHGTLNHPNIVMKYASLMSTCEQTRPTKVTDGLGARPTRMLK